MELLLVVVVHQLVELHYNCVWLAMKTQLNASMFSGTLTKATSHWPLLATCLKSEKDCFLFLGQEQLKEKGKLFKSKSFIDSRYIWVASNLHTYSKVHHIEEVQWMNVGCSGEVMFVTLWFGDISSCSFILFFFCSFFF